VPAGVQIAAFERRYILPLWVVSTLVLGRCCEEVVKIIDGIIWSGRGECFAREMIGRLVGESTTFDNEVFEAGEIAHQGQNLVELQR
jgi:hypothetical protein